MNLTINFCELMSSYRELSILKWRQRGKKNARTVVVCSFFMKAEELSLSDRPLLKSARNDVNMLNTRMLGAVAMWGSVG